MPNSKKLLVFLSYSSHDRAFVKRLNRNLRSRSIETWLDEQNIPLGASITAHVQEGLHEADVLLVFLSVTSVASRWVNAEWQTHYSRQLNGKSIATIPVLLDDCEIPAFLADRKYIDFRKKEDYETNLSTLLAHLEEIRAERLPDIAISDYMRSGSISSITRDILFDLEREQISFPLHKRMPIVDTLRQIPRSGKKVRLEHFRPKVCPRTIYDHLLSLAHVADCLFAHIDTGVHENEYGDIALCIAYHEINEIFLGDIPTYTSLSNNKRNSARIFAEERLRTVLPQERERISYEFIRMFLSDKHRYALDAVKRILSDPKNRTCVTFKMLDKIDPIIATWRYLHHYRGKIGNTPKSFNSAMKDFFENPDVKSYLRANKVDSRLIDLVLKLQDRRKAWDYYEDPSRIFGTPSLFEIPSSVVRSAIEDIPLFCPKQDSTKRKRRLMA